MKRPKVAPGSLRVRAYPVLERAVEEGIAYGWRRAHKHTDKPAPELIREAVHDGVLSAICEVFDFPEDDRE